jgi:ribosomal protein S18 acetylase RimI-like enzyme
MTTGLRITRAAADDAAELTEIHIAARRDAMPYLPEVHTDAEIAAWFAGRLAATPDAFWIARDAHRVVGYLALHGTHLDDLYVRPGHQGRGVGSALLERAKVLSPRRLELAAFQENTRARAFYEARGFREVRRTDGDNEEGLPDIHYEWSGP